MTDYPLAIFVEEIGARSETFIRRHIQDLLPGRTVAIGRVALQADLRDWAANGPVFDLTSIKPRMPVRALRAIASVLKLRDTQNLSSAKRFLRKHKVQALMGEYLDESLPWLKVAQGLGIKFFAHAHGYDVSELLRSEKWRTAFLRYNEADGVITMSEASRRRLIDLGLTAGKVHAVPYGVDVPEKAVERPERENVRCLAVGRMIAKKGPILALDAFRRAAEVCPELSLDYVGGGALLPAARQFVHAFGLDRKVSLHGSQSNDVVQRLMHDCDIFVQHSITDPDTGDQEGLPVAILEAMAHALPVVSTHHAGIPEAVIDGTTGYLVAEGQSVAMAERLADLVDHADRRRQMGKEGWERARTCFSWEREKAQLLNVLGLEKERGLARRAY